VGILHQVRLNFDQISFACYMFLVYSFHVGFDFRLECFLVVMC
jgi:hypothetical protein